MRDIQATQKTQKTQKVPDTIWRVSGMEIESRSRGDRACTVFSCQSVAGRLSGCVNLGECDGGWAHTPSLSTGRSATPMQRRHSDEPRARPRTRYTERRLNCL